MSDKHVIEKELEASKRQWLKLTRDDQVFVAPVLSFTSFTLLAIGDKSLITHVLALVLMLLLFQIVVTSHIQRPRFKRVMIIAGPIVVVAVLASVGVLSRADNSDDGRGITTLFCVLLTAGVILRMFGRIARARVINMAIVVNAISVYLLIGLLFTYIDLTLATFSSGPFFVQGEQSVATFLYFSFITLVTIGYGDFTPALMAGRFSAVAEGLFGQLYLVTFLAMIVANLGRTRDTLPHRIKHDEAAPDDQPES